MNNQNISFIGLGSIGLPIVNNLLRRGYFLNIYSRSGLKQKDILVNNFKSFSNPYDASLKSDLLFICVTDDTAVEDLLFGLNGSFNALNNNSIVIDFSTISPSKARSISNRLCEKGIIYIDAPVTGGTEAAKDGSLTIFLGCKADILYKVEPILKVISKKLYYFDEVGRGQEVKLINQILVASSYAGLAEAIGLGQHLGLPMNKVLESLKYGAGSSWALLNRSRNMLDDNYPLGFKLNLHHKDLIIALKVAKELEIELSFVSKIRELEEQLIDIGYGDDDLSVLRKLI